MRNEELPPPFEVNQPKETKSDWLSKFRKEQESKKFGNGDKSEAGLQREREVAFSATLLKPNLQEVAIDRDKLWAFVSNDGSSVKRKQEDQ